MCLTENINTHVADGKTENPDIRKPRTQCTDLSFAEIQIGDAEKDRLRRTIVKLSEEDEEKSKAGKNTAKKADKVGATHALSQATNAHARHTNTHNKHTNTKTIMNKK